MELFPRIQHVAAQSQSTRAIVKIERNNRENYRTDHLDVDVQRHLMGSKDNEKECKSNAQLVSLFAKRFAAGQWSFLGPGSEKKWYSISEDSPQGEWDKIAEKMMLTFAESGCPIFRATSPLSRGVLKSKGGGKLSTHFCADGRTIETVFRTIISVNQLSYLRSSLRFVRKIQSLPCKNRETCYGRTI